MIVLDASGSMNQTDAPGPRIDAAKTAVTDLLGTLPTDAQVGLMVYGTSTGSTDAEKTTGCQDIKTLAPVGPLNPTALTNQIQSITASGYTPIGNALTAAADALPHEGPRSIVLVSDGEDTCAPPTPCDVARDLHQQGIDLTVHTVGFKVDATARDQLTCIATTTGGTYSDAADAGTLTQALQTKVDYAITGYTTSGTPVTGADQPTEQAPLLTPGQYTDTFAEAGPDAVAPGTTKYYTVPVAAGTRPYISATIIPPNAPSDGNLLAVDAALLTADRRRCANVTDGSVLVVGESTPVSAVLDGPTFGGPDAYSFCPADGVMVLQVSRRGPAFAGTPLTIEIVVRMEPPADTDDVPPAAGRGATLPEPSEGPPIALAGGNSFTDAPQLTGGVTYSDTLSTGESRYYRIPLRWGQRFAYRVTELGPAQPSLGVVGSAVRTAVFNPVRADVTDLGAGRGNSLWFADQPMPSMTSQTPFPARYTNRDDFDSKGFSLDGDYFLRVAANRTLDGSVSTTGFVVTVVIDGDAEPGPVYRPAGGAAGPAASTSDSPQTASGAPVAGPTDSAAASVTPTSAADGGVPIWVWALAAALTIGAAVTVAVVWGRRRRATGTPDS